MTINRDEVISECCRLAAQHFYLSPETYEPSVTDMAAYGPLPEKALYRFHINIEGMSCSVTRTQMAYKIDPDTSNVAGQAMLARREQVLETAFSYWFGTESTPYTKKLKDDYILDAVLAAKSPDAPTHPVIEDIHDESHEHPIWKVSLSDYSGHVTLIHDTFYFVEIKR